jgi:uncharacterized membrane-anchored protein
VDERDRLDLGNGPTIWLVEHRVVFACLFAALAGALGYFGLLGRMGPQAVSPGVPGLIYGATSAVVVFLVVLAWTSLRRRRR